MNPGSNEMRAQRAETQGIRVPRASAGKANTCRESHQPYHAGCSDCHLRIHLYAGRPLRVPGQAVCIGRFQYPKNSGHIFSRLAGEVSAKSGAVSQLESEYDRLLGGTISYLAQVNGFAGERGQVLIIPTMERLRLAHIILLGLGPIPEVQRTPAMAFIDAVSLGAQVVSRIGGDQMHLPLSSFGGLWQAERELAVGLLDGLHQGLTGLHLANGGDLSHVDEIAANQEANIIAVPPYFNLDLWAEAGMRDIRNALRWAAMQRRQAAHWQGWQIDLKFEELLNQRGMQHTAESPGEEHPPPDRELAVLGLNRGESGLNYRLALPDGQVINDLAPASPRTLRRWLAPFQTSGASSTPEAVSGQQILRPSGPMPENLTAEGALAVRELEEYDNLWTRLLPADIKRVLISVIEKTQNPSPSGSHYPGEANQSQEKKCIGTSLVVFAEDENLASLPWEIMELDGHRLGLEVPLARCFKDTWLEAPGPVRDLPIHAVLVGSSPVVSELRELPGLETTVLLEPNPLELLQVIHSLNSSAASTKPEILHIFNKPFEHPQEAEAQAGDQEASFPPSPDTTDALHLQGIALTARNLRHALGEERIRLVWLAGNFKTGHLQTGAINSYHFARTWLAEGVAQAVLIGNTDLEMTFQVYQSLLEGQTIGQAVQTARRFAQKQWGPAGWMDLQLFGDPRCRLVKPQPGVGYAIARLLDQAGGRHPKDQPLRVGRTYTLEIRLKGEIPLAYRGQALAIANLPYHGGESSLLSSEIVEVLIVAPECRVAPHFHGQVTLESTYAPVTGSQIAGLPANPSMLRFSVCPETVSDPLGRRKPVLSVQFFQGDQFLGMIEMEIPVVEAGHV